MNDACDVSAQAFRYSRFGMKHRWLRVVGQSFSNSARAVNKRPRLSGGPLSSVPTHISTRVADLPVALHDVRARFSRTTRT